MRSMRVITWWALLALATALLAAIAQATLVVPTVQCLRPVVDTFPLAVASLSMPYALLPSGHHFVDSTRKRLIAYHDNHRGRPGSMFRRLAAARLKHLHTSDRIRLDQKAWCMSYTIAKMMHLAIGLMIACMLGLHISLHYNVSIHTSALQSHTSDVPLVAETFFRRHT